ncbi:MAG: GNVR domain-containing protein [Candidatus Krumholzibacteriaceae bacterium]
MESVKKVTSDEEQGRINLHAYWKVFWRKKFYLIVPLVLSGIIAYFGVRHLTPVYESHTMISIEDKNILSPTIERYVPEAETRNQIRDQQFRSVIETRLKSNDFLKLVIEELGLQNSDQIRRYIENVSRANRGGVPIDDLVMRQLVGLLKKKIGVDSPMSGFFTIEVFDTDPATAYVLAEHITESFINVTRQEQIQGIRQAGAFSDEQLAIYKEKLEASEKDLALIKREMADSEVEHNPVNSANVNFARALKQTSGTDADRSAIALKRVRDRLVQLLNVVPSSDKITSDETVRNCENKIVAYGEEKLLRDLAGPQQASQSPDAFNDGAAALRSRIDELVRGEYHTISPDVLPLIDEYFYQRSLNDYYSFIDRKLQGYIDQYSKNYEMRPGLEREFNRLTQEVETNQASYKVFLESKTSARISEAVQTTNLGTSMNIIERAEKPLSPVKPNPLKIMLLAVMFGGACGLAAIVVTEYMDDSFRSIEEVERVLKTPVLGTVPKMAIDFTWEKKKRGVMIAAWIVGVALFVAIMSGALYMYAKQLKSSGLGIELKEDQRATEVQK